jgi:hypothetical protein
MVIPRTRGAISGLLIVLLGAFGALVPFIGPSFNFTIGPDASWHMTSGRFWLSLLPGVVAVVGGLIVLFSAHRAAAVFGAQMALAAGIWFVVGPTLSVVWSNGAPPLGQAGRALGGQYRQMAELLAYFYGVGAAITAFAALAFGRMTVRGVRDAELAAAAAAADGRTTRRGRTGRFDRGPVRRRDRVAEPAAVGAPAGPATAPARDEGVVRGPVDRAEERMAAAPATGRRGGFLSRFRRR